MSNMALKDKKITIMTQVPHNDCDVSMIIDNALLHISSSLLR